MIAYVESDKLIIRPLEPLEERIRKSIIKKSSEEVEKISEKIRREAGIFLLNTSVKSVPGLIPHPFLGRGRCISPSTFKVLSGFRFKLSLPP